MPFAALPLRISTHTISPPKTPGCPLFPTHCAPLHIALCKVKCRHCAHARKFPELSIANGRNQTGEVVYYAPFKRTKVRYKLIGKPPALKTGVGQTPCASSSLALTAKRIGLLVRFMQPRC